MHLSFLLYSCCYTFLQLLLVGYFVWCWFLFLVAFYFVLCACSLGLFSLFTVWLSFWDISWSLFSLSLWFSCFWSLVYCILILNPVITGIFGWRWFRGLLGIDLLILVIRFLFISLLSCFVHSVFPFADACYCFLFLDCFLMLIFIFVFWFVVL